MDKQLEKLVAERNIVVIMKFGSHLYGTETPESDTDYKGVYIPTKEEILLQKVPKSINITPKKAVEGIKNTADDVDIELYSLQYFIELCLKGETVSIDMLHCNQESIVYQEGKLWEYIQSKRAEFYTKNLSVLVGYCRKQAAKYGCRGSRIAAARNVLNFLEFGDPSRKLGELWEQLPLGEHIQFIRGKKITTHEFYQVCGIKFQTTIKVSHTIDILKKFILKYGQRALLAEKNEGIDHKAVSHAMRYAFQLKELFETKDIKFPLVEREFILKVKKGELDYKKEVAPKLDDVIKEVEILSEVSCFPEKADREPWIKFIKNYYEYVVKLTELKLNRVKT